MNLQINFTECCITSLDLPQRCTYKGELNISKRSTEMRLHQSLFQHTCSKPFSHNTWQKETGMGVQMDSWLSRV